MPNKKVRKEGGGVEVADGKAREFELDGGVKETTEGKQETTEGATTETSDKEESSGAREGELESAVEPRAPTSSPSAAPAPKDLLTQKIEHVLEEDLGEVYKSLPPERQAEFQRKGEEVAGKIRTMIETAKFSFRKALGLIRDWLRIIPGVNRFFLEQEAKIKADKISDIAKGG
ncbi:TPA: hypothetical protein DDZ10_00890 [Candidatus Uhrbacteria bacterium]|nr:MAG: hypothetical protein A3D69_00335 [Candidatus Uhrbacteria bacterium RIFCSPHIGHO2_02_FULL_54_11]HBL39210.1 hypothetical protein [Candidatus Uhrbacteria bacterium]